MEAFKAKSGYAVRSLGEAAALSQDTLGNESKLTPDMWTLWLTPPYKWSLRFPQYFAADKLLSFC